MTALDANPGDTDQPAPQEAPAPPIVGPMAGDPAMLGLSSFIVGSIALGLGLVGVVPVGVLGAPLAIILAATALGLLLGAVWAAAVGQSAVAAVFGIFGTFWLSYALLDLALLLLLLAFAEASPLGVPSTGLLKTAGYVVLVFAAVGVYLFYDAAQAGTGGKRVPLGRPLIH
jgi:succinate-acetate transporter protein